MKQSYDEYVKHHPTDVEGAWPRLEYEARQTGRTYRMMEAAKLASKAGKAITIVVKDMNYGRELARLWHTATWPTTTVFHTIHSCPFHIWDRALVEQQHPHRAVFISHEAIENEPYLRRTLIELHRFDGKLPWEKQ